MGTPQSIKTLRRRKTRARLSRIKVWGTRLITMVNSLAAWAVKQKKILVWEHMEAFMAAEEAVINAGDDIKKSSEESG